MDFLQSSTMKKPSVVITTCDSLPGYCCAQYVLKQKNMFEKVKCGGTDRNNKFMKDLQEMGADVCQYDLHDTEKLKQMFQGTDCAVLIPPLHQSDVGITRNMIEAAKKANVQAVGFLSVLGCDKANTKRLRQLHQLEEQVQNINAKCVCIWRKGFLMDVFFGMTQEFHKGKLPLPTKDKKCAPISIDDVCQGIAKQLVEIAKGEHGERAKVWELTGTKAVDAREIAKMASQGLQSKIEYHEVSPDQIRDILRHGQHFTPDLAETYVEIFELISNGHMNKVTDDLKKLLGGKEPTSVEKFFEQNQNEFRPR